MREGIRRGAYIPNNLPHQAIMAMTTYFVVQVLCPFILICNAQRCLVATRSGFRNIPANYIWDFFDTTRSDDLAHIMSIDAFTAGPKTSWNDMCSYLNYIVVYTTPLDGPSEPVKIL